MLASVSLALLVGFMLGGRLANLGRLQLRWTVLAIVSLALQLVPGPGTAIPLACLYLSFALLVVFAAKNLGIAGFWLVLAGVALNFTVIGLNRGMPVGELALEVSGQTASLDDLMRNPGPKHHLQRPDDVAVLLGDVIALPQPIGIAISVGDILTYGGIGVVIAAGMLPAGDPAALERVRS